MARKGGNPRSLHVVPYGKKWAVKEEGAKEPSKIFETRRQRSTPEKGLARRMGR
nr:DUF2188 domain-containing protein [Meiothermus sp. QL-1]